MRIDYYVDEYGEWRWACYAENGREVGRSSQSFTRKDSARINARRLRDALTEALAKP